MVVGHTGAMTSAHYWFEIPRSITANVGKLVIGLFLAVLGAGLMWGERPLWQLSVAVWVIAVPLIASNTRLLVMHPPVLRATPEGLWFGGGAVIPWYEVECFYEAGVPIERYGFSVRTRAINVAFRRKRMVLRLPSSLWLTTWTPGHVKLSLHAVDELPNMVVSRLEALRKRASGDEVREPDAAALPGARIVSRS
jgi:hypothetical protein